MTRHRIEELANRVAAEINVRAAKMTPADRKCADAETKKIAERVRRRHHAEAKPLPTSSRRVSNHR